MTERIIPIADLRYQARLPAIPDAPVDPVGFLADARGRRLHDLRISVTDRCNFRCTYCMPKSVFDRSYQFLPQSSLLSFEEIERVVRIAVPLGVNKIRLTGGEPLVRRDLHVLVKMIAAVPGIKDIGITTKVGGRPKKLGEADEPLPVLVGDIRG